MDCMRIEDNLQNKDNYPKSDFASNMECNVNLIDFVDNLTKKLSNDYPIDDYGCLVGNISQNYCGRWFLDHKQVWVGRYFDNANKNLKNKLCIGFFIFDSKTSKKYKSKEVNFNENSIINVAKKNNCNYYKHCVFIDGGYWYYIILNDVLKMCITEAYKTILKLIWEVLCCTFSFDNSKEKKEKKQKPPKRWHYWISRGIVVVTLILIFIFSFLFAKCSCCKITELNEAVLIEKKVEFHPNNISNENEICLYMLPPHCKKPFFTKVETTKVKFCCLSFMVFILFLMVSLVLLMIYLIKGNSAIKLEKLNDLYFIKQKLLENDFDDSVDKTTEISHTDKRITEKQNRADLLKHYMTCITEL